MKKDRENDVDMSLTAVSIDSFGRIIVVCESAGYKERQLKEHCILR